jgi:hypothetical protein
VAPDDHQPLGEVQPRHEAEGGVGRQAEEAAEPDHCAAGPRSVYRPAQHRRAGLAQLGEGGLGAGVADVAQALGADEPLDQLGVQAERRPQPRDQLFVGAPAELSEGDAQRAGHAMPSRREGIAGR